MNLIKYEQIELYEKYLNLKTQIERHHKQVKDGLFQKGNYKLENRLSVNYFSYSSNERIERDWEMHQNHIDVHVVLEGEEMIDLSDGKNMTTISFDETNDCYIQEGIIENSIKLEVGDILILYPGESHKTGIKIKDSKSITKLVYKIEV